MLFNNGIGINGNSTPSNGTLNINFPSPLIFDEIRFRETTVAIGGGAGCWHYYYSNPSPYFIPSEAGTFYSGPYISGCTSIFSSISVMAYNPLPFPGSCEYFQININL